MSNSELMPAINLFEKKVDEAERKVNELLSALNIMRAEAGMPPRAPGGGGPSGGAPKITQIKSDTFFGMRQQSAIRTYLEMRKGAGNGPATPREIYDALVAGGYKYTAKDAETAMVGLRALLRKRTGVFVKVGNGAYGLVAWYPDLKPARTAAGASKGALADDDDDEADEDAETAAAQEDDPDDAAVA